MTTPIPIEWRSDVDQEASLIRDMLDDFSLGEMMSGSTTGRTMAAWGVAVAANILNADSDHQRTMRAWAWIETLEAFR